MQDAVYDSTTSSFCQAAVLSDYTGISGSIDVNGVEVITFTDLSTGTFTYPTPLPVTSGNAVVTAITLENTSYVAMTMTVVNLWDAVEVTITLNKTDYKEVKRTFTVFGYDIGKNPNIAATSINPDMHLVMIPTTYGSATATTGSIAPAVGYLLDITADFPGAAGNSINLVTNGFDSLESLIVLWNNANPFNTATLTYATGSNLILGAAYPLPLTGGVTSSIAGIDIFAYANFVGWRKPFTNDLYLHANYSQITDSTEYKDTSSTPVLLAQTHIAILPCYDGTPINLTSTIYDQTTCHPTVILDTCTYGPLTFNALTLIPTFSCGITCVNCCTDANCLVKIDANNVQFILDTSLITALNNDDTGIVSTETVTLKTTLYDGCGNYINDNSAVISLNPLPALSGSQVGIAFPAEGDYAVVGEISTDAYSCTYTETFTGCSFYKIVETACGKNTLTNLGATDLTLVVEVLDKDKNWAAHISSIVIAACDTYEILTPDDGVYRITATLGTTTEYKILIQDCVMKACFVEFTNQRVCNPKADCACGGNCSGLCNVTPTDVYDFNAFSILTYNYFALLNDLYVKNFVYTVFTTSDTDKLYSIKQYLDRIKEYCGTCTTTTVDTNTGTCGCS